MLLLGLVTLILDLRTIDISEIVLYYQKLRPRKTNKVGVQE